MFITLSKQILKKYWGGVLKVSGGRMIRRRIFRFFLKRDGPPPGTWGRQNGTQWDKGWSKRMYVIFCCGTWFIIYTYILV
jgi:hypothetical protein